MLSGFSANCRMLTHCTSAVDMSALINQSISDLFAHNTSSNEAVWPSRWDEQDSQAPGALLAALNSWLNKCTLFADYVLKLHSSDNEALDAEGQSADRSSSLSILGASFHFVNAVVAILSSQLATSSSALWSFVSPLLNFVDEHLCTVWFFVCWWSQSPWSNVIKTHLCKQAQHGPWPV